MQYSPWMYYRDKHEQPDHDDNGHHQHRRQYEDLEQNSLSHCCWEYRMVSNASIRVRVHIGNSTSKRREEENIVDFNVCY